ncbi:2-oxo acid dehydrogenase subunit E2 [Microbacterium terrisoli]|uniref:2-oxo acid dehydrogenase subunit E2 n=1 Tax=Microbacterium terrisoli TaxID=3242192 RepID=UPI002805178C|nr:2-oxo acid dehydrogenase subunit E2 [Microbacterium protaetiae]
MVEIIRMPAVLAGASEGAIQTWLVKPGSYVSLNQTIAEIETDKAVVDYQAEFAGTVGRLLADEGASIAVGGPILALVDDGESDAEIDVALSRAGLLTGSGLVGSELVGLEEPPYASAARLAPTTTTVPSPAADAPATVDSAESSLGRRLFASPLVRRLALQRGVDLSRVPGSGPNGRVVRRDLDRYLGAQIIREDARDMAARGGESNAAAASAVEAASGDFSSASYEDVPLDRMRKAIARRLTESKSTVPHFYLVADCRVDDLLALRAQVNAAVAGKISVNDFVVRAVAGALMEVPEANASWNGQTIRRYRSADVAVAVAVDGGLSTPVIRGVERLSLGELSTSIVDAAAQARSGTLRQHQLEGGSFSVSNLGMYGVAEFSAILNPPQAGILAVGAARRMPVVDDDGQISAAQVMTVTLSADHRVLDGAIAARWLAAFQRRIEHPMTILV